MSDFYYRKTGASRKPISDKLRDGGNTIKDSVNGTLQKADESYKARYNSPFDYIDRYGNRLYISEDEYLSSWTKESLEINE